MTLWGISFPAWMLTAANFTVLYGVRLVVHSTVILFIGLIVAFIVRWKSPSAQSLVLRVFLAVTCMWIFLSPYISVSSLKGIIIEIPKVFSPPEEKIKPKIIPLIVKKTLSQPFTTQPVTYHHPTDNSSAEFQIKTTVKNNETPCIQSFLYQEKTVNNYSLSLPPNFEQKNERKAILYIIFTFLWILISAFLIIRIIASILLIAFKENIESGNRFNNDCMRSGCR